MKLWVNIFKNVVKGHESSLLDLRHLRIRPSRHPNLSRVYSIMSNLKKINTVTYLPEIWPKETTYRSLGLHFHQKRSRKSLWIRQITHENVTVQLLNYLRACILQVSEAISNFYSQTHPSDFALYLFFRKILRKYLHFGFSKLREVLIHSNQTIEVYNSLL
jgi:DNA-directed RNA polymerase subunit L